MQGWAFFSLLGYVVLLFSVASYSVAIGLSAQQGTIVSALLNLGQMLGRPFVGLSSDRFGRINLAASLSVVCGIFCFVLWIPTELCPSPMGLLVFFVLVGGALAGTFWSKSTTYPNNLFFALPRLTNPTHPCPYPTTNEPISPIYSNRRRRGRRSCRPPRPPLRALHDLARSRPPQSPSRAHRPRTPPPKHQVVHLPPRPNLRSTELRRRGNVFVDRAGLESR